MSNQSRILKERGHCEFVRRKVFTRILGLRAIKTNIFKRDSSCYI
jgi:hypothetical protein